MKKIINLMAIVAVIACASCQKPILSTPSTNFPSPNQLSPGQKVDGTVYYTSAPFGKDENGAYVGLPAVGSTISVDILENGYPTTVTAVVDVVSPGSLFEIKDQNTGRWSSYAYDQYSRVFGYGIYNYGKIVGFPMSLVIEWEPMAQRYVAKRRISYN